MLCQRSNPPSPHPCNSADQMKYQFRPTRDGAAATVPLLFLAAAVIVLTIALLPTRAHAQGLNPVQEQVLSNDATLSSLSVSPRDINGFTAQVLAYQVGVAADVTEATVTAAPTHSMATLDITPADADDHAPGHQVSLSEGRNTVTVTVTAEDGNTEQAYEVSINQGATAIFGWKAQEDFDTLVQQGNLRPAGVWSDGTTMWVTDHQDNRIYAYNLATKAHDSAKSITSLPAANTDPTALWSNGTFLWVLDRDTRTTHIYRLSNGAPAVGGFTLAAENTDPKGIWSDGTTFWIADSTQDQIYAYTRNGTRVPTKDFGALDPAGNTNPSGIWSNGHTMWVADVSDNKLYAYGMSDKTRRPHLEYDTLNGAGNGTPQSIWSDGSTMWVADYENKIFAYHAPVTTAHLQDRTFSSTGATSGTATVSVDYAGTAPYTLLFRYREGDQSDWTSSTATGAGAATLTWTLTDLAPNRSYNAQTSPFSSFPEDQTIDWNFRNTPEGRINIGQWGNISPRGIWTDGTTIWVVDSRTSHLYPYTIVDGQLDLSGIVELASDNSAPRGLYSDGDTMWVSDWDSNTIFAYDMEDAAPTGETDPDKNLTMPDLEMGAGLAGAGSHLYAMAYVMETIHTYDIYTRTSFGQPLADRDMQHHVLYGRPKGMTATSDTVFTVDGDRIHALHTLTTGADYPRGRPLTTRHIDLPEEMDAWGIALDGPILWVADDEADALQPFYHETPTVTSPITNVVARQLAKTDLYLDIDINNPDQNPITLHIRTRQLPSGSWTTFDPQTVTGTITTTAGSLAHDEPYEIQVSTSSSFGAGTFAFQYQANSKPDRVKYQVRHKIVPRFQESHPWVWEAYRALRRYNTPIGHQVSSGSVAVACLPGSTSANNLGWCSAANFRSDYFHDKITVHEMAHVYSIVSGAPQVGAETAAMGWVYFNQLAEGGNNCDPGELYADGMATVTGGGGQTNYYVYCSNTPNSPSSTTRTFATSIATFQTPQWFKDRYTASGLPYSTSELDGYDQDYDLEKLTKDIRKSRPWDRISTTYQFRNSFGGYCHDGRAWSALNRSGSTVRNPWRAGGCVPQQVQDLTVTEDTQSSELELTWDAPTYDGGTPITKYTVSWRSWNQEFSQSRSRDTTPDQRSTTIEDLTGHWEVQVAAVNANGDSTVTARSTTTPPSLTGLTATANTANPDTLVITVTAEDLGGNPPDVHLRYQPEDGSKRWTKTTHTAAASLTITAAGLLHNTNYRIQASFNPDFSGPTTLSTEARTPVSPVSDLASLTVSPKDIYSFDPDRYSYHTGVPDEILQATVEYETAQPGSPVTVTPADADENTDGHQVQLQPGLNTVTITVTSSNGANRSTYTITIGRSVTTAFGWDAKRDLNFLPPGTNPTGLSQLGGSLFHLAEPSYSRLPAYLNGQRFTNADIRLASDNKSPTHLGLQRNRILVTDPEEDRVHAYNVHDYQHELFRTFDLHDENADPTGITATAHNIWVVDHTDGKIYAYSDIGRDRRHALDFTLSSQNEDPAGIWTDGATLWVADGTDGKIYAYELYYGSQLLPQEFRTLTAAGNTAPSGISSDGTTMWVTDTANGKVYAYNMPPSRNAYLKDIAIPNVRIINFRPYATSYQAAVPLSRTSLTLKAFTDHDRASITSITPSDADENALDHQVDLQEGSNEVSITVTAQDTSVTTTYTLTIFRINPPGAPEYFTATPRDSAALLEWDLAGVTYLNGYQYRYRRQSSSNWTQDWTNIPGSDTNTVAHTVTGLQNGTTYVFEVRAISPAGEGAAASAEATPAPPPAPPRNLAATPGEQEIALEWDPHDDTTITHYQYRVSDNDRVTWDPDWSTITPSNAATTSYTVVDLANGTEHTIELRAVSRSGSGTAARATATPVHLPEPPVGLSAQGADAQATLTWTDPSDPSINEYQRRYRRTDTETWILNWTAIPGSSSDTVAHTETGLSNEIEYTFELRAKNEGPAGPPSSAVVTPRPLPAAPANLSTRPTNATVRLTWDDPGNPSITGYQVRHRPTASQTWLSEWTRFSPALEYTFTGLSNGTGYTFELRAVNSSGHGPTSTATATPNPLPAPAAPTGLSALGAHNSAILSWDDPGDVNIGNYQYRHQETGASTWDPDWTDVPSSDAGTTSHTVSPLTPGTNYTLQIRAVNADNNGLPATATAVPTSEPDQPTTGGPLVSDGNPIFNRTVTADTSTIQDGNGLTNVEYSYQWLRSDGAVDTEIPGATDAAYTVQRADIDHRLKVRVSFQDDAFNPVTLTSAPTAPVPAPTPPGAPINLQPAAGDGTITLTWQTPAHNGNSPITAYLVQYQLTTDTAWTNADRAADPTALTHVLSDLRNGYDYRVQVAARNSEGVSPWAAGTARPTKGQPDAPREVTVAPGDESITVTWQPPEHHGDGPITAYTVKFRKQGGGAEWKEVQDRSGTDTSLQQVISELENLNRYNVRIAAVNDYGASIWAEGSGTTWTTPGKVRDLRASAEDEAILVTWQEPETPTGLTVTYKVVYHPEGSPNDYKEVDRSSNAASTQQRIPDLTNGKRYRIFVQSVNQLGDGDTTVVRSEPGVCRMGPSQEGYWRISWLDTEDDPTVSSGDYSLDTLKYCLNGELPGDRHLYQRQLCKDATCYYPDYWTADERNFGPEPDFCVATKDGCTPKGDLQAAVAALEDIPLEHIGLMLNAVFMEDNANGQYAARHTFTRDLFLQHTVEHLAQRDDYLMFTVCDGAHCGPSTAILGRDLRLASEQAAPPPPPPAPPGPPQSLSATLEGESSLAVTWSEPADKGNSDIAAYIVKYRCEADTREEWQGNHRISAAARSAKHSIPGYLDSSDCRTSTSDTATLNVRVAAENNDGLSNWAAATVEIPAKQEDSDSDDGEDGHGINPQPADAPVKVKAVNDDTETHVSFEDPSEKKCSNYYIEAWGPRGYIFRVNNAADGAGSRTLPLVPKSNASRKNEINYVSVFCGTLSEDRGEFVFSDTPGWNVTVTPEDPDNPGSGEPRHVGTVNWRSN